ncbi:MAG: hypothetical protein K9N55_04895 [Phycisphaerae bacterium]|nr:hypothetical protein [Phycisphaerae bacterium]
MKPTHWVKGCLNGVAACLIFRDRKDKAITPRELKAADFRTSTQGLGLRMTDHIRDVFRFKWLRKH